MKKIFTLLLTVFLFTGYTKQSKAQTEWAPIGAKWYYTMTYASVGDKDYNYFESVKDTIINSVICKKVQRLHTTCDLRSEFEYMFEDSNMVYFYNEYTDRFDLLYDFNKQSGEEWYIKVNSYGSFLDSLRVHVDSTSNILINSYSLKVLYTTISGTFNWVGFSGKIIEKFGHEKDMFPFISGSCDENFNSGLRCYEDTILGLYQTGISHSCDYSDVGILETYPLRNINVFPNPINEDELNFNNSNHLYYTIKIYDSTGNIVFEQETNKEKLNISSLNDGFYIVCFYSENNEIRGKAKIIRKVVNTN